MFRASINNLVLTLAIVLATLASQVATIGHIPSEVVWPSVFAAIAVWIACVPALLLAQFWRQAPANHLLGTLWRLSAMLLSALSLKYFEGAERNCYLATLLACYFVSLPLESWLVIRDVRHQSAGLPKAADVND